MSNGGIHIPGGMPPGAMPHVVKVNPIEVRLLATHMRFCFDPSQIRGFEEIEGGGVKLYFGDYTQSVSILGTYDKFAERCGVSPQVFEAEDVG